MKHACAGQNFSKGGGNILATSLNKTKIEMFMIIIYVKSLLIVRSWVS